MECSVCKIIKQPTKDIKNPCFPCDSCRNIICQECSDLSTSELRCIPLQKRSLIYNCKKCRAYELVDILKCTITDKQKIINDQETIIALLKEKIEKLEGCSNSTYASAARQDHHQKSTTNMLKRNFPKIIVKPKKQQTSQQTKTDIHKNIDPANLKIGVSNIKPTKTGSMIIKCQSKNELDVLKQALDSKLKHNYDIQFSKLRHPRIKIVNVNMTQEYTHEDIEDYIIKQNSLMGEIKVTYIRKNRNGTKTIFCECEPKSFHQILNLKRICLGWERYMVYEDLTIPKCFNCQGYFHKKDECRNKRVCPVCSEGHEENGCPKERKFCNNCHVANNKYNTRHATDHETGDQECPTLKFHIEVLRSKINYID